eukprot:421860-Pyramimonas_sp.AAC.1
MVVARGRSAGAVLVSCGVTEAQSEYFYLKCNTSRGFLGGTTRRSSDAIRVPSRAFSFRPGVWIAARGSPEGVASRRPPSGRTPLWKVAHQGIGTSTCQSPDSCDFNFKCRALRFST